VIHAEPPMNPIPGLILLLAFSVGLVLLTFF